LNPRAADGDTLLITAFNNDHLVAYIGILPDLVWDEAQQQMKFGWLTAWWVDKESDSRLAASVVLFTAMKRYAYRLAASSPSKDAIRVYEATRKFHECARFEQSYLIMALPPRFGVVSASLRRISSLINRLIAGPILLRRKLEIRMVDCLDEELSSFIDAKTHADPLNRDASYWRWILKSPWMSTAPEDRGVQDQYAFSLFAKSFRQIAIAVKRNGAIVAFVFATLRDGRLSVKYAVYDIAIIADVAVALQLVIAETRPWLFVCADMSLNFALRRGHLFCLLRRSGASSAYATTMLPLSGAERLQYGIGDSAFT
jgi:hypothetical protein